MACRLQQQKTFTEHLLSRQKSQVIAILQTINKAQVLVLSEITQNVLQSNIILSSYFRRRLSVHLSFYKDLGDKLKSYKTKIQLVKTKPDLVYQLLQAVRKDLTLILNGCNEDDSDH
eukprot:GHVU01214453.1.p2 GENE.GHVU01214453.1~~GHVU01214453.1.p2  ORF type:complete len:117 (+),score=5.29 GHVU01214453.1:704-1054(+)